MLGGSWKLCAERTLRGGRVARVTVAGPGEEEGGRAGQTWMILKADLTGISCLDQRWELRCREQPEWTARFIACQLGEGSYCFQRKGTPRDRLGLGM